MSNGSRASRAVSLDRFKTGLEFRSAQPDPKHWTVFLAKSVSDLSQNKEIDPSLLS